MVGENPKIATKRRPRLMSTCWDPSLDKAGPVDGLRQPEMGGQGIRLTGRTGNQFQYCQATVLVYSGTSPLFGIFGEMNQQGAASGQEMSSSSRTTRWAVLCRRDASLSDSLDKPYKMGAQLRMRARGALVGAL